jgi:hypothetical protein
MGVLAFLWPATASSHPAVECSRNPDQSQWFVRAHAAAGGIGTRTRPFRSLADIERCAPAGATITVRPSSMPLDGGYRGDITPADGNGDALGDCSVFEWSGNPKENPPPVKPVPGARCELYNIPLQGSPSGIDGRFHLASDPGSPK